MLEPVRLAIVGSTTFRNPGAWYTAEWIVRAAIDRYKPAAIISGGAVGIDSLAKTLAYERGLTIENGGFVEHLPKNKRWAPEGFQARNELIIQDCTRLLRVSCKASKTYGSGWTADHAQAMGKDVERIIL